MDTHSTNITHHTMRIAGQSVDADDAIEVLNPYNGTVVGTVPNAHADQVTDAFAKAASADPNQNR